MRHATTSSILSKAGFRDSGWLAEIVHTVNEIDKLGSEYFVLDDECYGNEAMMFHEDEVPTNREFWTECGIEESRISDPDDYVPTKPILDYVDDNGGLDRPMCEKRDEWVISDLKMLIAKLEFCESNYQETNEILGDRQTEIMRAINSIEKLGSRYLVLDDSRYGEVVIMYNVDELPTNREFWTDRGVGESEIPDPDDYIPAKPLIDYVIADGELDRITCEKCHKWTIADIKKDFAKLQKLAESN